MPRPRPGSPRARVLPGDHQLPLLGQIATGTDQRGQVLDLAQPGQRSDPQLALALDHPRQRVALGRDRIGPGIDPVGDQPHLAARLLPGLERDPLERARRHDQRRAAPERDAAVEIAARLEPTGLVLVEAVLVMHERRQLVDVGEQRVGQRSVHRAPVVGADEVVTGHRLRQPLEARRPGLARERRKRRPGDAHALADQRRRAAPPRVAGDDRVLRIATEGVDQLHAAQFLAPASNEEWMCRMRGTARVPFMRASPAGAESPPALRVPRASGRGRHARSSPPRARAARAPCVRAWQSRGCPTARP